MGLSNTPPQLDAGSVSRSSRDPLLGHGLVDVVARREDTRTRRLPSERGGHILREVADDRPIFLKSELIGDRQEEGVGLRERPVLAQLLDESRGVGRIRAPEGRDARVEVSDLVSRGAPVS